MHAFCNQNTNWSDAVYQRLFPTKYISPKQSSSLKFFVESSCLDKTVPIADVTKFVDTLQQNQISVLFKKDANGGHTWPYWQEAVPHAYSWLSSSLKK